jgi:hypothetical protein
MPASHRRKGVSFAPDATGGTVRSAPPSQSSVGGIATPALLEALAAASSGTQSGSVAVFGHASQDVGATQIDASSLLASREASASTTDSAAIAESQPLGHARREAVFSALRSARLSRGAGGKPQGKDTTSLTAAVDEVQPTPQDMDVALPTPSIRTPATSDFQRSLSPSPSSFDGSAAPGGKTFRVTMSPSVVAPPPPPRAGVDASTAGVQNRPGPTTSTSSRSGAPGRPATSGSAATSSVATATSPSIRRGVVRSRTAPAREEAAASAARDRELASMNPHLRRLRTEVPVADIARYQKVSQCGVAEDLRRNAAFVLGWNEWLSPFAAS